PGELQALRLEQGPLMQLNRLGRVVVRMAGSEVALPDLHLDDATAIFQKLQEKTTQRTNHTAPSIAITSESTPTTTA
ncbi:MAG TPA: PH domain-containing protein, partial [Myxococcota bacterium]|nr:PH domain-containing protein [Myxococcota bacterium]